MVPKSSISIHHREETVLECDPGGVCLEECHWVTPIGQCHFKDSIWSCEDPTIHFLFQEGTCNIKVKGEKHHEGTWTCHACPYQHTFTDELHLEVIGGEVWWKEGWTAILLWTSVAVIIILIIILIVLLLLGLCPICPCRVQKRARNVDVPYEDNADTSNYQRVEILDGTPSAYNDFNTYENFPAVRQDDDVEYDEARHYSGKKANNAVNIVNHDAETLQERMRKASGIGSTNQLI